MPRSAQGGPMTPNSVQVARPGPCIPRSLVPAYFGPWQEDDWDRLSADRPEIVVVNPANGPGTTRSPPYRRLIDALRRRGSNVLMYVHTDYFRRDTVAVAADVRRAFDWFGVDGVFFDEVPVDDNREVRRLLRFLAGLSPDICVFNAGRAVPKAWFSLHPNAAFVTFEGSAHQFVERFGSDPHLVVVGPGARQVWLVHSLPARSHRRYLTVLADAGIGFGYLTSDRLPNPWDVYSSTR